jgi:hypothetical protein
MKSMKKSRVLNMALLILTLIFASPLVSSAKTESVTITANTGAERTEQLVARLEEIKGMDTKKMTRSEKKALRSEVRTIKKELAVTGGGIYLSVGALILIALLLILLL